MKKQSKFSILIFFFSICSILGNSSCNLNGKSVNEKMDDSKNNDKGEYFSVKIDGKIWEAFPSKEYNEYTLSYKELGHQFSIFTEAKDGSRMDLSFHSWNGLKVGSYPSTRNDKGMLSGVFYFPEAQSSDRETGSTSMDFPIQENTVQVTKIDKKNPKVYIIEGTFSPIMYALYQTNPKKTSKLTDGKFRVLYRPDGMKPSY